MTNSHGYGAVSGVLVALSLVLAPLAAKAEHEPKPRDATPAPIPAAAPATPAGFYFLIDLSTGDTKDSRTNAGFDVNLTWTSALNLGLGYRTGPIRLEGVLFDHFFRVAALEVGLEAPFEEDQYAGGVTAQGLMANVFYDIQAAGRAKPYLGAGYGYAKVEAIYSEAYCYYYCYSTTNDVVNDWDQVAVWQAMAGVSFPAWSPKTEWFVGYRYFGTADANLRTTNGIAFTQDGLQSHSVNGGFRFFF